MTGEDVFRSVRAGQLCEGRGERPGLPVPNSPYGLCGRKAALNQQRQTPDRPVISEGAATGLRYQDDIERNHTKIPSTGLRRPSFNPCRI